MRFLVQLLVFVLVLFVMPVIGCAQEIGEYSRLNPNVMENRERQISTRNYNETIEKIFKTRVFMQHELVNLRFLYPYTDQYKAFSKEILDEMIDLSYKAKNTQNPDEEQYSIRKFYTLLKRHFANLEVLLLARSISQDDVRFGDTDMYRKASDIIYQSIFDVSDGLTPRTSFKLVTFGEEDVILKRLGKGRLIKSEMYQDNNQFVNVNRLKSDRTGEEIMVLFDISIPMRTSTAQYIKEKEQAKTRKVTRF